MLEIGEIIDDLDQYTDDHNLNATRLGGLDGAVVGIYVDDDAEEHEDGKIDAHLVYSEELIIKILAEEMFASVADEEERWETASEWYGYNTVRTLPYIDKETRPMIINSIVVERPKMSLPKDGEHIGTKHNMDPGLWKDVIDEE